MDRAYDSDAIRDTRAAQAVEAVMPAQQNRTEPMPHDPEKYPGRNQIARFFHRPKQFRRMATSYDTRQCTCRAFIHGVAAWIALK